MNPWIAFGIGLIVGFFVGFLFYSFFKVSSDNNRMWEGYFEKLKDKKEEK